MKILLTSTASHMPPRGGATRSNLAWLRQLAARGHECMVVGGAIPEGQRGKHEQLEQEKLAIETAERGVEVSHVDGLTIYSVLEPARRLEVLRERIAAFTPDWVLVSTEDLGQVLLGEALAAAPDRVIYLAHTPQWFPFGPASWARDAHGAELVRRCAGVIAIGRYMAAYIREHAGVEAAVVHPPIYGSGPYENLARFGQGLVTMINPCAVKGIDIFREVARAMPDVAFGALPGWGTTAEDRASLAALGNVEMMPHCRGIEDFLRRTRVLLMPSLWLEGFGLIVMEAMLRGIPVIASTSGGLSESKEGTGYVVPVREIERYLSVFDEHAMPRPVIEAQETSGWIAALRTLLTDEAAYRAESEVARKTAAAFVGAMRDDALESYLANLAPAKRRLRVLLAQNSPYYPAHGGGDKSNRLLVEALAAAGHECLVVARTGAYGEAEHARYMADLERRSIAATSPENGIVAFTLNGVDVRVSTAHPNFRAYFAAKTARFTPDVILTSTDDPAQLLLEAALQVPNARVVYLARATLALPFGADAAFPSEQKTAMLRRVDAAVGVSEYVAAYMREQGGMNAVHVPISLMEPGACQALGKIDNEFVTMVNPCAVKGLAILLALADAMPGVRFAAVPTWGTIESDLAELRARANITVLDPVDRIDDLLARTRALIVPSLWAEARSRIVVEAMMRGVPVLAANVGGIPEAKLGVPYLLPVTPIARYFPRLDQQMVPVADVPAQDSEPWRAALAELLSDNALYERIARDSREAALAYVDKANVRPFEALLLATVKAPRASVEAASAASAKRSLLDSLSPEKRRLLALRLKKKTEGEGRWFSQTALAKPAGLRLFCFPHAGGGIATFHGWNDALGARVAVCPARLPGRESRAAEAPLKRMEELVAALSESIAPHLDRPFAFYGHSMGAAVGFELARALRRAGKPMPAALLVSGARAPQFRRGWTPGPEPTEDEFLEQLRRLDGVPREVLDNRELMRLLLPSLRADASLYRHYVYAEEAPLGCPIRAYGGVSDPNVQREHLEAWGEQTTASFALRTFAGGHFFLMSGAGEFLRTLGADLNGLGL